MLVHTFWKNFVESLRSYAPNPPLQGLLSIYQLNFPSGSGFPTNSQLVALPTGPGLKVYIPTKDDYFFREEMSHDASQKVLFSNTSTKFGISVATGFSDAATTSRTIDWSLIIPILKVVVSTVSRNVEKSV